MRTTLNLTLIVIGILTSVMVPSDKTVAISQRERLPTQPSGGSCRATRWHENIPGRGSAAAVIRVLRA